MIIPGIEHTNLGMDWAEFLLHGFNYVPNITEPMVTTIGVGRNTTPSPSIVWYGHPTPPRPINYARDPELFYFPIAPPDIPEWELMHPSEWVVRFVGTVEGYPDQLPEPHGVPLSSIPRADRFAILQTRTYMTGLGGKRMWEHLYIAAVVCRQVGGQLVYPAPYVCQLLF